MQINQITLATSDLDAQLKFYCDILGLIIINDNPLIVEVGSSWLIFEHDPDFKGYYHFAFNIPENQFANAKHWISQRVPLITDNGGNDEFDFKNWNAHSLYFYDAAQNILELIARHDLKNATDHAFSERDILNISEIGIAVEDVPHTVKLFQEKMNLPIYDPGGDAFCAAGDEHGLFIVVKDQRVWYPDTGKPAAMDNPLTITAVNDQRYEFSIKNGNIYNL